MKKNLFILYGIGLLISVFNFSCKKTESLAVEETMQSPPPAKTTTAMATIQNDTYWMAGGGLMCNQGGYIFKSGSTYYWFGVQYGGAYTHYVTGVKNEDHSFVSVNCYSSTDMVHWSWVRRVLVPDNNAFKSSNCWVGRIGVVRNPTTGKYVLVMNYWSDTYGYGVAFATSSTLTGNYTYNSIQNVITNVYYDYPGDQTIFVDDDGKAYLVFSDHHGRTHHYVAPLRTSDYLYVEPATKVYGGLSLEADCMFKYNGKYYRLMSETAGWSSSQTYWASSASPLGTTTTPVVMANTAASKSYNSQVSFVTRVTGSSGTTMVYVGDRWSDFSNSGGTGYYVMEPLSWSGTVPSFNALASWKLDASTGTWAQ